MANQCNSSSVELQVGVERHQRSLRLLESRIRAVRTLDRIDVTVIASSMFESPPVCHII
jgi:hypothetical protein